jgi:uncharacterized membrane protein
MNITDQERVASGIMGAALLTVALFRGNLGRWLLSVGALALLGRGWLGRCDLYARLGVDRRHSRPGTEHSLNSKPTKP